jgi:hypothetical protein
MLSGATTEAAESVIAQLSWVSSLRRDAKKFEKFDTKTKFLKQLNPLSMCRNFRFIKWHQKHTTKSRETIPLILIIILKYFRI